MALWVACGHGFQDFIHVVDNYNGHDGFLPSPFFQQAFYAHFAVDVFIVLSGFCLMLPVARNDQFALPGGWGTFLTRRAKRILPPYYTALLLGLGMSALRCRLWPDGWEAKAIAQVDFAPKAILAHIFLVQNMWDPWARAIDGPTWSVATESQIYILFPLFLLPLWRRLNPVMVILFVSAIGTDIFLATRTSLCTTNSGLTSCAWYLGLFAMGMYAAQCHVRKWNIRLRPWLLTAGLAFIAGAAIAIIFLDWMPIFMWALDLIIGAATALMLAYLSSFSSHRTKNPAVSFLELRPLVALGTFSYSFYLIHAPILNVVVTILLKNQAAPAASACILGGTILAIIFLARIFYQLVELPSMYKRRTNFADVSPR